jgi:Transposase
MSVCVGIDVHRKRSQVAIATEGGQVQLSKNVVNGSEPMLRLIGDLPAGTPVAFEAAFGWGWLVRLLEDYGFEAHLVHPLRCKAIASARLKNDKAGAAILAQLLRADLLPEAWIAPPEVRQLRPLLRHRAGLVRLGHPAAQPDPRGRTCEEGSRREVSPARRRVVARPGSYALLTLVALMGAASWWLCRGPEHCLVPGRLVATQVRLLAAQAVAVISTGPAEGSSCRHCSRSAAR